MHLYIFVHLNALYSTRYLLWYSHNCCHPLNVAIFQTSTVRQVDHLSSYSTVNSSWCNLKGAGGSRYDQPSYLIRYKIFKLWSKSNHRTCTRAETSWKNKLPIEHGSLRSVHGADFTFSGSVGFKWYVNWHTSHKRSRVSGAYRPCSLQSVKCFTVKSRPTLYGVQFLETKGRSFLSWFLWRTYFFIFCDCFEDANFTWHF